jgi:DNA-binding NtrC family response regulator
VAGHSENAKSPGHPALDSPVDGRIPHPHTLEARVSLSILVVDDDRPVRLMLRRLFEPHGFRVLLAESAPAAREILEADRPTLVISDVVMPGESGIDLRREIARRWPDLTVILISGFSLQDPARVVAQVPNTHFLPKPFAADGLLDLVFATIGRPAQDAARS